jgi:hypothetical protein
MQLTKDNLVQWKEELRREMFEQYGINNYDKTYRDEDWLQDYLGFTPQDVIDGEVECWEP